MKPQDYHIYVDLDGVMANLQGYVESLGIDVKLQPGGGDWANSEEIWKQLRQMGEPDFSKLELLPDAVKLWKYVRKYKPNILTATGKPVEKNDAQKRKWVEEHLSGYNQVHTVVASANKAKWAWPDAILIDDRMKSIGPWRQKGGIGILHTSADDTIKQLKELGL